MAIKPSPAGAPGLYFRLRLQSPKRVGVVLPDAADRLDWRSCRGCWPWRRSTSSSMRFHGRPEKHQMLGHPFGIQSLPDGCLAAWDAVFSLERTKCRGCSVIILPHHLRIVVKILDAGGGYVCTPSTNGVFRKRNMRCGRASESAPDWESARISLRSFAQEVSESGAEASGKSVNALRRRVDDLEECAWASPCSHAMSTGFAPPSKARK